MGVPVKSIDYVEIDAKAVRSYNAMFAGDLAYQTQDVRGFQGTVNVIRDTAQTITTSQMRCPNAGILDTGKGHYRYLTERECWRLQGFTDADYDAALAVNPTRPGCMNGVLYRQAGTAMPVPILEEILKHTTINHD